MRSRRFTAIIVAGACLVLAGQASAQIKGTGKLGISIVKTPGNHLATVKAAGALSSKPSLAVAGKPPTGGAVFAFKLAKDVSDPLKPGYPPGEYVAEAETGATPTGNAVNDPSAAAFFIAFTIDALGKCTIHVNPEVDPNLTPGPPTCGTGMNPVCAAPAGVGKCSANIYQVAGSLAAGLMPGDPFSARFRIRQNPDTANCETGHLLLAGTLSPPTSVCRTGKVVGVGGVALADNGL